MQADAARPPAALRVDGAAAGDDFLMQFQADLLGVAIDRPACRETTAIGAAALAALALGWQTPEQLAARPVERRFEPARDAASRQRQLAGWHKAVARAVRWAE